MHCSAKDLGDSGFGFLKIANSISGTKIAYLGSQGARSPRPRTAQSTRVTHSCAFIGTWSVARGVVYKRNYAKRYATTLASVW